MAELNELGEMHYKGKNGIKKRDNNAMIRLKKVQDRIQEKISNRYENNDDCPVCYEKIEKTNLIVPLCFHNICVSCYDSCDYCPLCREAYL